MTDRESTHFTESSMATKKNKSSRINFEGDMHIGSQKDFVKDVKASGNCESRTETVFAEFGCHECKKSFKTLNYLQCHKRSVHQIHVTICEYCSKEFKNRDYYKKHVKHVHEAHYNNPETCEVCSKSFKSKPNLYHHKKAVHDTGGNTICHICAHVSKNEQALRKHVKKCEAKASKGPDPLPLGVYTKDIQVDGDTFICKQCHKIKPSLKSLTAHIRVAHTYEPLRCHLCSNSLKNVDYLKKHYRVKHSIQDIKTINQFVKIVKPDHEPTLVRMKNKQKALDKAKSRKIDDNQHEKKLSVKDRRAQMVERWRQIEKEQTKEGSDSEHIKIYESDNCVKSEDETSILDCEVKMEVSEAEVYTNDENNQSDVSDLEPEDNRNADIEDSISKQTNSTFLEQAYKSTENLDTTSNPVNCISFLNKQLNDLNNKVRESVIEKYKCTECIKTFESATKIKAHIKNVHTFGQFLCPECGLEFILKQQLKNHINNHHNAERLKGKPCELCLKVVKNLKRHKVEMHSNERFVCKLCSKTFRSRNQLRNHTVSVHPNKDQLSVCPACAKSFANSYYMKKHLKLVHGNMVEITNDVSCEECGKLFANEVYLHHHQKYAHEVENSVCQICSKNYKNKRSLQRHIRYAHNSKPNTTALNSDILSKSSPTPMLPYTTMKGPAEFPANLLWM